MNWFDIVLLVILLLFLASGFSQGLIGQLAGILGFLVALVLAYFGSDLLSGYLADYLKPEMLAPLQSVVGFLNVDLATDQALNTVGRIAAFLLLLFVVQIILRLLVGSLSGINRIPVVGIFNRAAGAILGLLRGLILAFILVSVFSLIPVEFFVKTLSGSRLAMAAEQYLPAATSGLKNLFLN